MGFAESGLQNTFRAMTLNYRGSKQPCGSSPYTVNDSEQHKATVLP